ncbi:MAG: hypothetical protein HKN24_01385 [Acidimicrobiales bacterium]|nr:hypothetical protein [Acidimicrobiales bacterium]
MTQNDFPTSPAATGGDAELAAELVTNAALAISQTSDQRNLVIGEAREALHHFHPDVRVSAIAALSHLDAFTAADLEDTTNDPSPSVRRRAVEAAAVIVQQGRANAAMARVLMRCLDDVTAVAEPAAFAIGEFGPGTLELPAIAALERQARSHADALCRESAVAALGALHEGVHTVLAAMTDKATVRRRAVLALAPFDGDDVTDALTVALTDRDWQVRQAAEDQLEARA